MCGAFYCVPRIDPPAWRWKGEGVGLLQKRGGMHQPESKQENGLSVGAVGQRSIPMKRISAPEVTREQESEPKLHAELQGRPSLILWPLPGTPASWRC